jgi:hypothetical protein
MDVDQVNSSSEASESVQNDQQAPLQRTRNTERLQACLASLVFSSDDEYESGCDSESEFDDSDDSDDSDDGEDASASQGESDGDVEMS